MNLGSKKDTVFLILAGFFITNAIVAELIGGKLVMFFGTFTQSIGIVMWPIVFIVTDLVNEYYGQKGVRKLSFITVGLIGFTFLTLYVCIKIPATNFSPVTGSAFKQVFGQSQKIIIASMCAFIVSQLVDSSIFWLLREKSGKKMMWLRSTGSTIISQMIDTFIVQFGAFVIPGTWTMHEFAVNASYGYVFKLLVAVAVIPIIYLAHFLIDKYLGKELSHDIIKHNAESNLHHEIKE
jgi:uncharacterized integral membrane protein (TIGR00697 family)